MAAGDFLRFLTMDPVLCERAAECGLRSFQIMAGALDGLAVEAKLLSHEDVTGVGYGVATFTVTGPDEDHRFGKQCEELERLLEGLPTEMTEQATGVFVSLHAHGQLRGCIGTTGPTTESVAWEIVQNAVSACA